MCPDVDARSHPRQTCHELDGVLQVIEHARDHSQIERLGISPEIFQRVAQQKPCSRQPYQLLHDQAAQVRAGIGLDGHDLTGAAALDRPRMPAFERPDFDDASITHAAKSRKSPLQAWIVEKRQRTGREPGEWLGQAGLHSPAKISTAFRGEGAAVTY